MNGNQLILTASDLETTMSCTLDVESEDNGMIALPAKILLDTLKTFPEQPLTFIKTENNSLEIVPTTENMLCILKWRRFPKIGASKRSYPDKN